MLLGDLPRVGTQIGWHIFTIIHIHFQLQNIHIPSIFQWELSYAFLKGLFSAAIKFKLWRKDFTWNLTGLRVQRRGLHDTSPKFNSSPLKNGCWKPIRLPFGALGHFSGAKSLLNFGRVFSFELNFVGSTHIWTPDHLYRRFSNKKTTQKTWICWRCGFSRKKNSPWSRSVVIECYGL